MDEKTGYAVVTPNRPLRIRLVNEACAFAYWKGNWSQMGDLLRFTQLSPRQLNPYTHNQNPYWPKYKTNWPRLERWKLLNLYEHCWNKADEGAKEALRQCLPKKNFCKMETKCVAKQTLTGLSRLQMCHTHFTNSNHMTKECSPMCDQCNTTTTDYNFKLAWKMTTKKTSGC
jgi:hypothetical protein